jgi:glucosamine-6-phosphate deaminase
VGIDPRHPQSYRSVITTEVVEPLGLDPERIHTPNGDLASIAHAGEDYERAIADAGGIDLQILGIGTSGHIGFNEPGSSFASRTRVKTLIEQTATRQRPLLRLDRRRADALHHAGARHDPVGASPVPPRLRRGKAAAVAGAVEAP